MSVPTTHRLRGAPCPVAKAYSVVATQEPVAFIAGVVEAAAGNGAGGLEGTVEGGVLCGAECL